MSVYIDGYLIDASLSEDYEMSSAVTSYPVESGARLTDHVQLEPLKVTLDCIVSDTPIGTVATARVSATTSPTGDLDFLPSDEALAKLEAIREAREPVTIQTALGDGKTYENMVLQSLTIHLDETTGHALRFTATFQQIKLVTNNRTIVRVATPSVAKRRDFTNSVLVHEEYNKILDEHGQPVRGVHFDNATGRFVDSKGVPIFAKNTTDPTKPYYFDPSRDHWVDKDAYARGTRLTQGPNGAPGPTGPAEVPWWWNK